MGLGLQLRWLFLPVSVSGIAPSASPSVPAPPATTTESKEAGWSFGFKMFQHLNCCAWSVQRISKEIKELPGWLLPQLIIYKQERTPSFVHLEQASQIVPTTPLQPTQAETTTAPSTSTSARMGSCALGPSCDKTYTGRLVSHVRQSDYTL